MFYVDNPTGVPVMPPVAAELSKTTLYFTEGGMVFRHLSGAGLV